MGHDIKRQKNMRGMKSLASPAFFFHQMKQALHICLIFLFLVAPEKGPTEPSLSPFLYTCLCSSPWLALTHWSASGWKNRRTLLWVCQRRWKEGERRNEEGRERERRGGGGSGGGGGGGGIEEGEGWSGRGKKNLSIQMTKRKVNAKLHWPIILLMWLNHINNIFNRSYIKDNG